MKLSFLPLATFGTSLVVTGASLIVVGAQIFRRDFYVGGLTMAVGAGAVHTGKNIAQKAAERMTGK